MPDKWEVLAFKLELQIKTYENTTKMTKRDNGFLIFF